MEIQPDQIKQLQTICSGKFRDRDERIDAVSDLLGFQIRSFKDLNSVQADDLIRFFNTGKSPDNSSWGKFDKHNSKHRTILSRCHTLGWVQEENNRFVDLHRLGGWLKSSRSPVQRPLMEMEPAELSKIIKALDGIVKSKYK
jgi:hypothetical protein